MAPAATPSKKTPPKKMAKAPAPADSQQLPPGPSGHWPLQAKGKLLQGRRRITDMPRGGIEGLQTPQIRPGLVRQDHAGAGIVFPRGGLHCHRRLGGDHMGIQDLQAIGRKILAMVFSARQASAPHSIICRPIFKVYSTKASHSALVIGVLLSCHITPPPPSSWRDPMLGGCHILPQSVRNYKWRSPQKGRKGLLGFHGKPTHSILPLTAGRKIPYNEMNPICPLACKGGHIWRQPVGIA